MPDKQSATGGEAERDRRTTAWVTVAGAFSVLLVTGHFQYSFGVFLKPMIDMFGWSRAAISGIVSTRGLVTGLASPVAGALMDRYGSRRLILPGVFLFALGFFLASQATALWQFYLFFGVLVGMSNGIVMSPTVTTVTKWFGGKSARANGITMSGLSMAQTVFPPIATYLILSYGWETALVVFGIVACTLGAFAGTFIRDPPQPTPLPARDSPAPPTAARDFTLSEALGTMSFWTIFGVHMVSALGFQMVGVHIVVAAVDLGAGAGAAALLLTVMGGSSTLGRLTLTGFADRTGVRNLIAGSLLLQAGSLLVLAGARDINVFYVTAAVFGLLYGTVMPLVPSLTSSYFGTRFLGAIFGVLNLAYLGGAAIGPLIAGYIFDVTRSYYYAFTLAAALAAMAFLLCLTLKRPRQATA